MNKQQFKNTMKKQQFKNTMKKHIQKSLLWALIASSSLLFNACDDHDHDDDDHKHDEGELINSVALEFIHPSDTTANFTVLWTDEDGIGGNDPILPDTIRLQKDSLYQVKAHFYHLHDGKNEEVNAEILQEATDHLVCYTHTSVATVVHLEILRTDKDAQNLELGLTSTWKGLFIHDGGITVALKHQPKIKNGSCAIGETDVEVTFPVSVK